MKRFIQLDEYYNLSNPVQGAVLLSYDSNTKKISIISEDDTLAEFSTGGTTGNIPTKLSQLQNDTQFITIDDVDLEAVKTQLKAYADSKIVKVFTFKGTKNSYSQLPNDPAIGDVYIVGSNEYVYTGTDWEELGSMVDLTNYATKTQLNSKANSSDVYTKAEIDSALSDKVNKEEGKSLIADTEITRLASVDNYDDSAITSSLSLKADKSNSLAGYGIENAYTKDEIDAKGYLTSHQDISDLAKIANVTSGLNTKVDKETGKSLVSDTEIIRLASVDNYDDSEIRSLLSGKAQKSTTLVGYGIENAYTKDEIDNKGYLTAHQDISDLAKTSDVTSGLSTKVDKEEGKSLVSDTEITRLASIQNYDDTEVRGILSGKAQKDDVYTKDEIDNKGYLTSHQDISDLAKTTDVTSALSVKVDKEEGKSLLDDSEITRLASLENYDDTEIRSILSGKQDIIDQNNKLSSSLIEGLPETIASEAYVETKINQIVNFAPSALDTLKEFADAISGDANFATTITTELSKKVDKVEDKDLIATSAIAKLQTLENYDDTNILSALATKANSEDLQNLSTSIGDISTLQGKSVTSSIIQMKQDIDLLTDYTQENISTLSGNIPTNVSQLTNDSGYLTEHQSLSGKADVATELSGYGITDAYTKDEVDALVSGYQERIESLENLVKGLSENTVSGVVATSAELPTTDVTSGTICQAGDTYYEYNGTQWVETGITNYVTKFTSIFNDIENI